MQSLIRTLTRKLGVDAVQWMHDTRRMRQLVARFDSQGGRTQGARRFAIVLTPWMGTAVPWFCMVLGLFLGARGNQVSFIVDDMPFGGDRLSGRFQLRCIGSVLKALGGRHEVLTLSEFVTGAPLDAAACRSVERLAELNAVWALKGEMKMAGRQRYASRALRQLHVSWGAVANLLQGRPFEVLFVPGGVWGSTGAWVEHAQAAGIRVGSFDSGGYGNLLLAVNGIACQLQDIPRAFTALKAHAQANDGHGYIVESALAEMARRRAGTDKFSSQVQGTQQVDPRFAGAVLIALNSSWDSAALGLHEVFDNSSQWIVETTRYLLDHTDAPVVIRQHPAERLAIASTTDDYAHLLKSNFGDHPRVHFIAAAEPVNSYALMEQVKAVVVYTSTIGIEAAVNGKPVITASSSYYSDMGFVRKASTREQYTRLLSDALAGHCAVSAAMRDDALCCYYLTQCCNWTFTPFTVPEFGEWVERDLQQLSEEASVRTVLQALEENIPVAYLNHLARVEQAAALAATQ
jgi:hypothetical protein